MLMPRRDKIDTSAYGSALLAFSLGLGAIVAGLALLAWLLGAGL